MKMSRTRTRRTTRKVETSESWYVGYVHPALMRQNTKTHNPKIYTMNQQKLEEELEKLVDASNLSKVVMALSLVAGCKVEHIKSNRQDKKTAKSWEHAENILETASRHISV